MDQNVLFSDYCFSSHCSALQIARREMVILSSILCLIVAVTSIWGEESSAPAHGCVCVCDCEKLKIENNLLKHLILQRQEPSLQCYEIKLQRIFKISQKIHNPKVNYYRMTNKAGEFYRPNTSKTPYL